MTSAIARSWPMRYGGPERRPSRSGTLGTTATTRRFGARRSAAASAVVPAFEKRQLQIFRGRTVYFELHVVPGWARSVTEVELDDLLIAAVALIVVTAVAQVDATDEGGISTARATECDQLLVMAS